MVKEPRRRAIAKKKLINQLSRKVFLAQEKIPNRQLAKI